MNTRILSVFLCFLISSLNAQVLRDLNFSHLYNAGEELVFDFRVIKQNDGLKVLYSLHTDTTQNTQIAIQFETRESLSDKSGSAVSTPLTQLKGTFKFTADTNDKILVAIVTTSGQGKPRKFIYHKPIPVKKSPFVITSKRGLIKPFIDSNESLVFEGSEGAPLLISYYSTPFPAAAPAFSTTQSKVAKTIEPDSIISVNESTPITFSKKGLYLAQVDTASADGIAFRIEMDYPKLATLQNLAGPLIYICTNQENEKLKQVGNDKKKFDQVILSITGNADRARSFMRSFYRRVEYANLLFTSYKEGWKTDRGMIYIIFGPPDEVYLFDDREIWEYKDEANKNRFQFLKSPTLFDPENHVLIREKKYATSWYKTVDLWRKVRF